MSVPQGEFRGGVEQAGTPALAVLDPVVQRQQEFSQALTACADAWAPGRVSAEWSEWPQLREERDTPRSTVPGLVRIGSTGVESLPVLVPTLADGHLRLGDERLAKPIPRAQWENLPWSQQRAGKARAEDDVVVANANRRRILAEEARNLAPVARNLLTRTAAGMAPGSVHFTVYDTHNTGSFRDLAINKGASPLVSIPTPSGLAPLLEQLRGSISELPPNKLGGFKTMRELAASGAGLPRPWELVVIFGNGESLGEGNRELLELVLKYGPSRGISLLLHGIDVPKAQNVYPVTYDHEQQIWRTPANGDLPFVMDPAAPQQAAREAALMAQSTQPYTRWLPKPDRPPIAHSYRQLVQRRQHAVHDAVRQRAAYRQEYPLTTPETLTATAEELPAFLDHANRATAQPEHVATLLRTAFGREGTLAQRAQAWALFRLVRGLPNTPNAAVLAQLRYGRVARPMLEQAMPALAHTVAVTTRHGQHHLPEEMRPYIAQFLPEEPTPWTFQLVAEAAFPDTRPGTGSPEARAAVALHLERTYDLQAPLLNAEGVFADPTLAAAASACELLFLYDFAHAPRHLQEALARHVAPQLDAIEAEQLPGQLRGTHNEYRLLITEIREAEQEARRERAARRWGRFRRTGNAEEKPDEDATGRDELFDQDAPKN